jgi:Putative transposase/Kiwa protein KwaB-like
MTLATAEFIRRFLIHVLPHGFHRIRHYGLLASGTRADNIAQADNEFDFLITAQHVYILHPAGFERVAEIEEYASARAREMTLELAEKVKFLDFNGLSEYAGKHRRAARLVATLHARNDLATIKRGMFCKSAEETGVALDNVGRKLAPVRGNEIACLKLLDNRRYTTTLKPGSKPAFVASSRRPVGARG